MFCLPKPLIDLSFGAAKLPFALTNSSLSLSLSELLRLNCLTEFIGDRKSSDYSVAMLVLEGL